MSPLLCSETAKQRTDADRLLRGSMGSDLIDHTSPRRSRAPLRPGAGTRGTPGCGRGAWAPRGPLADGDGPSGVRPDYAVRSRLLPIPRYPSKPVPRSQAAAGRGTTRAPVQEPPSPKGVRSGPDRGSGPRPEPAVRPSDRQRASGTASPRDGRTRSRPGVGWTHRRGRRRGTAPCCLPGPRRTPRPQRYSRRRQKVTDVVIGLARDLDVEAGAARHLEGFTRTVGRPLALAL